MAAAHPFGAFVGCQYKRIGCICQIKAKQDCIKLVGVFQNQFYVCVALSEQMLQINVFLF